MVFSCLVIYHICLFNHRQFMQILLFSISILSFNYMTICGFVPINFPAILLGVVCVPSRHLPYSTNHCFVYLQKQRFSNIVKSNCTH